MGHMTYGWKVLESSLQDEMHVNQIIVNLDALYPIKVQGGCYAERVQTMDRLCKWASF